VNSAGYITARHAGKAKITVKTSNGKKAICKVTVTEIVPAIDVVVTPPAATLYVADTLLLQAELITEDPNVPSTDTIVWSSSDEEVATVSPSGEVVALDVGTAEITAEAPGSGKSATSVITVLGAEPEKDAVKITPGERFKPSFAGYGLDQSAGLTYSSSKENVATVSEDGYVQANFRDPSTGKAKTGTTTITATAFDGAAASIKVTVTNEPTIVDLSKWQGDIDWAQASQAIDLAILRVAYGADVGYEPKYKAYADSCVEYGIPFAAYSYCLYKTDAAAAKEAEVFYRQATADGRAPLFFVIDIEESFIKKAHTETYIARLRELAAEDGIARLKVGVYIGHHLYEKLNLNLEPDPGNDTTPDFLWIPRYNLPNNGAMAATAKTPNYTCDMWQYSSGAYMPGIKGKVDVNTLYDPAGNVLTDKDYFDFSWLIAGPDAA
jgi:GH25 family lysozyme M1 (1,4-beta-N-acetylmuramidase)